MSTWYGENPTMACCPKHGIVYVVDSEKHWGFCGPIFVDTLECGCDSVDASLDFCEP